MTCFVVDNFTQHILVKGIIKFIFQNCNKKKTLERVVDPTSEEVDHANINKGIGLILGSAAICRLKTDQQNVFLSKVNILMEHTIFGVVISGSVPGELRDQLQVVQNNIVVPRLMENQKLFDPLFPCKETFPHRDLEFLWEKENTGIPREAVHEDHKKAWEKFQETVVYNENSKEFMVGLPWNDRKYMLKTNKLQAIARTKGQQAIWSRDRKYGLACVEAKEKLVLDWHVESVDPKAEPIGVEHYLPWRAIIKVESETTKCRLVMGASAKRSTSDISLNQALYQGPNLVVDLLFCILRWMRGGYAAVSDIEKVFLKILI